MFACVGYANVFQQIGMFTEETSKFRSIATNSGASWFNTQLFYSQAFYDQVVMAPTPQHLYDFAIIWLDSYYQMSLDSKSYLEENVTEALDTLEEEDEQQEETFNEDIGTDISDLVPPEEVNSEFSALTFLVESWDLYLAANASYGYFYQEMMERATKAYGHDGDFISIIANAENRLTPMQKSEIILQTTISPSSKVRLASANYSIEESHANYGDTDLDEEWAFLAANFGEPENQDMEVLLGPLRNDQMGNGTIDDWDVYSVGISAYYLVNDTFEGFQYATHDSDSTSTLAAYVAPTHQQFDWKNFEGWYLFPNTNFWGQPTTPALSRMSATIPAQYNPMTNNMTSTGTLREAFGGGAADVIQSAATSSAFAGPASPAAPPVFAQSLSLIRQQFIRLLDPAAAILSLTAFDLVVGQLYKNVLIDNGAVCSQWPKPCGPHDGYFMDGAFSDNPSVVSNIAQYQNSADADLSKTIKLVVTNTNQNFTADTYDSEQILQYFETDFNKNITPGGYVWLPSFVVPIRSPQIFEEYLSTEDMVGAFEPMEGSNMTTAIYKGTTIMNQAFGTKAGQKVEMMFINTNSGPITTFMGGAALIAALTVPIAEMTESIAANEILRERLHDFFFDEGMEEGTENASAEGEEEANKEEGAGNEADTAPEEGAGSDADASPEAQGESNGAGPLQSTSNALRMGGKRNLFVAVVAVTMLVSRQH